MRDGVLEYAPQYPLWSDGTTKRRWISLPPGRPIDATRPDAWEFPPGTRLWKEFAYDRRIETRFIERLADGSWRYATYVWNAAGTRAELAPGDGTVVAAAAAPGRRYLVPSTTDCRACHEAARVPVLGFSAVQLSARAAGRAGSKLDLRALRRAGLIGQLPPALARRAPRVEAPSATARAAAGYLHANCGHCHNPAGPLAGLGLWLDQSADPAERSYERTLRSLVGQASRFRSAESAATARIDANEPGESVLTLRMRTDNPYARMPPLGVQRVDAQGLALIERWIRTDLHRHAGVSP